MGGKVVPRERISEKAWFDENDKSRTKKKEHARDNLRRHPRFAAEDADALMYVKGFLSAVGLGRSRKGLEVTNLSEGGILIVMDKRFARGTRVSVRVKMEKYKDSFKSDGVVRWCIESLRGKQTYYVGVEFSKLDDATRKKIKRMRDWFLSPEYKAMNAARLRQNRPEFEFNG